MDPNRLSMQSATATVTGFVLLLLASTPGLAQSKADQAVELLRLLAKCPLPTEVIDEEGRRIGHIVTRTISTLVYTGDASTFKMTETANEHVHQVDSNQTWENSTSIFHTGRYVDIGRVRILTDSAVVELACNKRGFCFQRRECADVEAIVGEGKKMQCHTQPDFYLSIRFCDGKTAQAAKIAIDSLRQLLGSTNGSPNDPE
jgi:hypothetical protein